MSFIKLNGTDINVSKVALGTALFGKTIDREMSFLLMDKFFENGGNLIDTANVYANWLPGEKSASEKTIGRWMSERKNRDKVIISTKGAHPVSGLEHIPRVSKECILADVDDSLKNLGTDYIDIYFLHRDDESKTIAEIMDTLGSIAKTGKIRSIGLSNWKPKRLREAADYAKGHNIMPVTSSQVHFGIAYPNPDGIDPTTEFVDKAEFDFYSENEFNLFSFSSQSGGYFFCTDENGRPLQNRSYDNEKSRQKFDLVMQMTEKYNCSVAEIIIASLCANKAFNTIPIIGCANEEQLKSSMAGLSVQMEDGDVKNLLKR